MPKGHVLTPDERQTVIEHRMNGVPVRAVSAITGHSTTTIVNVFRDYLTETAAERTEALAQLRDSLVARHEDAAFTARREAARAREDGDRAGFTRCLREERDSLREIARLTGADLPVKVQVSGSVDVNVRDPRERLAEYLLSVCPSDN